MSTKFYSDLPLAIIELLARIGSIASITLLILLFWGEAFHPSQITRTEWVGLLFFPIGITIGMILAWWREGLGSTITVGSLVAFYFVYGYLFRNHIGGWAFIILASPGFLFLLHWLFRNVVRTRNGITASDPRDERRFHANKRDSKERMARVH